tara:strand:+ start:2019 stop:2636 length:618 start_codon:yes stop_codon:yes gene_type:complete
MTIPLQPREELLKQLKEKCYRKGEFKLSSGKTSEHYVNCKPVTLTGRGLTLAAMMLLEHIETPLVAGLTLGADPLVSGVAVCSATLHHTGQCHTCLYFQETHLIELQRRDPILVDALIVRKEPKGHGTGAWIEGPKFPKGTKVTVLEDVTTTGGSAIKAVEKLRDAGYVVERVVTIVDRQEGATEAMKNSDLELQSLFTIEDLTE